MMEKCQLPAWMVIAYSINNSKNAPFVNLKVELSESNAYAADTTGLINNLKYLISASQGMESKDVIQLTFNGHRVYGLSRTALEGSTLGLFLLFPGDDTTVYFYFNNLSSDVRNFETIEDYRSQRDKFLDEYTKHLKSCRN